MKKILKSVRLGTLALLGVLFLGMGMKTEAAAPGQATGLKQVDDFVDGVLIDWTDPAGITGYQIEVASDASFQNILFTEDTEKGSKYETYAKSGAVPNLKSATSYYVRVKAYSIPEGGTEKEFGAPSESIEVVTTPVASSASYGFKQTGIAKTSATLSWSKVSGANTYELQYRKYGTSDALKPVSVGDVASYKLSIAKDTGYEVSVFAGRKSSTGYTAWANGTRTYAASLPAKIKKVKIEASGNGLLKNPNATQVYASWSASNAADGYQYVVYGSNGKKKLFTGKREAFEGWISNSKLTNKQFMMIKVRGYVLVNNVPKYGDWSDACWFAKFPKNKAYGTSTYMTLQWDKIKGATSYTIKISTKQKSGFKKVGTFKGNKCTITKCGKSPLITGKNYYFKIIPNKKIGKKTRAFDSGWTVGYTF